MSYPEPVRVTDGRVRTARSLASVLRLSGLKTPPFTVSVVISPPPLVVIESCPKFNVTEPSALFVTVPKSSASVAASVVSAAYAGIMIDVQTITIAKNAERIL